MMKLDDSEILIARTSFTVTIAGKRHLVVKGQRVAASDPAVKGREQLFHPAGTPKPIGEEPTLKKRRARS